MGLRHRHAHGGDDAPWPVRFEANREPEAAIHEGLWLHEPAVTQEEYQRYFADILAEGQRAGVRFTA